MARFVVIIQARTVNALPMEYRSVNRERAYLKALDTYNAAVARGESAIMYSSEGVHHRSWKPQRARLVPAL